MNKIIEWLRDLFRVASERPPRRLRLRVTRALMHALRSATMPTPSNGEPLAFLRVRFASENVTDVIVGIEVLPFPHHVYVDGFAGANFDTGWAIRCANESARSNAGIFLAHRHGGTGKPAFSSVDCTTNLTVMAPLSYGLPSIPYGAIVLSDTDATALVAVNGTLLDVQLEVVADALGRLEVTS